MFHLIQLGHSAWLCFLSPLVCIANIFAKQTFNHQQEDNVKHTEIINEALSAINSLRDEMIEISLQINKLFIGHFIGIGVKFFSFYAK